MSLRRLAIWIACTPLLSLSVHADFRPGLNPEKFAIRCERAGESLTLVYDSATAKTLRSGYLRIDSNGKTEVLPFRDELDSGAQAYLDARTHRAALAAVRYFSHAVTLRRDGELLEYADCVDAEPSAERPAGNAEIRPDPIRHARARDFAELRGRSGVAILYFTADWCGPCKAIMKPNLLAYALIGGPTAPLIAQFDAGKEMGSPEDSLMSSLGGSAFPYTLVYRDGELVAKLEGAQTLDAIDRAARSR